MSMLKTWCPSCHNVWERVSHIPVENCPYCGSSPFPPYCPDHLCLLDLPDSIVCQNCPKKPPAIPKPHSKCPADCPYSPQCQTDPRIYDYCPLPRWGGHRAGSGAPHGNLNHLVHGQRSSLLKIAVARLAADRELRAFLILIARAATQGVIPETTRRLIIQALEPSAKRDRRRHRRLASYEASPVDRKDGQLNKHWTRGEFR
jgi:hypothetical protein